MDKRHIPEEYRTGISMAIDFLKSWSDRPEIAPWDMGDEFMMQRAQMPQQQMRGFQDVVFHYLQMNLEGISPNLSESAWLRELENPEGWKNG